MSLCQVKLPGVYESVKSTEGHDLRLTLANEKRSPSSENSEVWNTDGKLFMLRSKVLRFKLSLGFLLYSAVWREKKLNFQITSWKDLKFQPIVNADILVTRVAILVIRYELNEN